MTAGTPVRLTPAGPGPLTALDPRGRVVGALVFAIAVVSLDSLAALSLGLALGLAFAVAARLPLAATARRVAVVDGFIIVLLLTLPFTTPGTPLLTVMGLSASEEGAVHALRIALKANAVMFTLLALVGTLDEARLGHALARLRVPAKLVHLLLMTVRYIDVLAGEYGRLRIAMKARGFRPGLNVHTLRTFGYLVGMLLVRALERAERVLDAMKCRGFDGRFHLLDDLSAGRRDGVFAGLLAVALGGLLWMEHMG